MKRTYLFLFSTLLLNLCLTSVTWANSLNPDKQTLSKPVLQGYDNRGSWIKCTGIADGTSKKRVEHFEYIVLQWAPIVGNGIKYNVYGNYFPTSKKLSNAIDRDYIIKYIGADKIEESQLTPNPIAATRFVLDRDHIDKRIYGSFNTKDKKKSYQYCFQLRAFSADEQNYSPLSTPICVPIPTYDNRNKRWCNEPLVAQSPQQLSPGESLYNKVGPAQDSKDSEGLDIGLRVSFHDSKNNSLRVVPVIVENPAVAPDVPVKVMKDGQLWNVAVVPPDDPQHGPIRFTHNNKVLTFKIRPTPDTKVCPNITCPENFCRGSHSISSSLDYSTCECVSDDSDCADDGLICAPNSGECESCTVKTTYIPQQTSCGGSCENSTCAPDAKCQITTYTQSTCSPTYSCVASPDCSADKNVCIYKMKLPVAPHTNPENWPQRYGDNDGRCGNIRLCNEGRADISDHGPKGSYGCEDQEITACNLTPEEENATIVTSVPPNATKIKGYPVMGNIVPGGSKGGWDVYFYDAWQYYKAPCGYSTTNGGGTAHSCTNTPDNATVCAFDNIDLSNDTPSTLVKSCTPSKKCEYTCSSGYKYCQGQCIDSRDYCPASESLVCTRDSILGSGSCCQPGDRGSFSYTVETACPSGNLASPSFCYALDSKTAIKAIFRPNTSCE